MNRVLFLLSFLVNLAFLSAVATAQTLTPNVLKMVVGETHTIQALNQAGQPVYGLTWISSDPGVVKLSTDNPPVLNAVAVGQVSITAGSASAEVAVHEMALAAGSVIWSNPGNGTGVGWFLPAIPSPSGIADVFSFQYDGTVHAITGDGVTAWTADVSMSVQAVPDFQGGLVLANTVEGEYPKLGSIVSLDALTGHAYPMYTPSTPMRLGLSRSIFVHTDGTVFALPQGEPPDPPDYVLVKPALIGINPATGAEKFRIELDGYRTDIGMIIAGDGYAYVPFLSQDSSPPSPPYEGPWTHRLRALRVATDGSYVTLDIQSWTSGANWLGILGSAPSSNVFLITNSDSGILVSWAVWESSRETGEHSESGTAIISGTDVSTISTPQIPDQQMPVNPLLQTQGGWFAGVTLDSSWTWYTVAFNASGNVLWTIPNEIPQFATADGGLIGASGIRYDQNGSIAGQVNVVGTPSWDGAWYAINGGSLAQIAEPPIEWASSFQTVGDGNPSGTATAVPFLGWREGLALWGLGRGFKCQLGTDKAPLAGSSLQKYDSLKQALMGGAFLTCQNCASFFNAEPVRASYFSQLTDSVSRQLPYDGLKTTISLYDAGLWTMKQANELTASGIFPSVFQRTPVCSSFRLSPGRITVAEAQAQFPATDVYVNPSAAGLKRFTQGTILHEALHNLTGKGDGELQLLLGLPDTEAAGGGTDNITKTLEDHGCVARP